MQVSVLKIILWPYRMVHVNKNSTPIWGVIFLSLRGVAMAILYSLLFLVSTGIRSFNQNKFVKQICHLERDAHPGNAHEMRTIWNA